MSGVDHIHTLTRQYNYRRFHPGPVRRHTCPVNGGFHPILGLNRRYAPRCGGNLNNQGQGRFLHPAQMGCGGFGTKKVQNQPRHD